MHTETEKIVGVLHDIVEDTPITLQELKEKGYSQEVIDALDHLTKREGENIRGLYKAMQEKSHCPQGKDCRPRR